MLAQRFDSPCVKLPELVAGAADDPVLADAPFSSVVDSEGALAG
jgi:hypothetical protein